MAARPHVVYEFVLVWETNTDSLIYLVECVCTTVCCSIYAAVYNKMQCSRDIVRDHPPPKVFHLSSLLLL